MTGPPLRPTRAEVDLGAVAHNVALVRDRIAPAEVFAVVKADGYGHGAVEVSRAALDAGATWLAVALVEEGEELRRAGVAAPILLLTEPPPDAVDRLLAAGLTPTVYTLEFADALRGAAGGRTVPVHVKADTGMARVGIPPEEWGEVLRALAGRSGLEVAALWTHLACADAPGHPSVRAQLERFEAVRRLAADLGLGRPMAHVGNSAAALTLDRHFDGVRLGIAMYGCPPSEALARAADLRPALRLVTEVAFAKRVAAGTAVSYGHTWTAPADGWLATLPVGYADGVPRLLSNRMDVLVGGRRHPIAGNVCMDQVLVWTGDAPVAAGDEAVLIGRQGDAEVTAQEWATTVGTISYEVVTGIGPRVPRSYLPR